MICHWVNTEAGRVQIPGCMGSAVYGPGGCTCDGRQRRKELEDRVTALEAKIEQLLTGRDG